MTTTTQKQARLVKTFLQFPGKIVTKSALDDWLDKIDFGPGDEKDFIVYLADKKLIEPKWHQGEIAWRVTNRQRTLARWTTGRFIPLATKTKRRKRTEETSPHEKVRN